MDEITKKGFKVFVREELKTVKLFKSSKGRFLLKTLKLNKDSLSLSVSNTIIPESTMMIMNRMFLGGFLADIKIGEELDVFQIAG